MKLLKAFLCAISFLFGCAIIEFAKYVSSQPKTHALSSENISMSDHDGRPIIVFFAVVILCIFVGFLIIKFLDGGFSNKKNDIENVNGSVKLPSSCLIGSKEVGVQMDVLIVKLMGVTLDRIGNEINSLTRRAIVNMVVGIIMACGGIALLCFLIYRPPPIFDKEYKERKNPPMDLLLDLLPKLSIVALIEVFAFFFLRLYKSSLIEVKYFQNEGTNVEFLHSALLLSLYKKSDDSSNDNLKNVIDAYLRIERNPLLGKDQRYATIDMEKLWERPVSLTASNLTQLFEIFLKTKNSDISETEDAKPSENPKQASTTKKTSTAKKTL